MSDELTPLEFSTTVKSVPVTVDGVEYSLRETNGDQTARFVNAKMASMRVDAQGRTTFHNVADLVPLLVHFTLYDANGKNVPQSKIKSWPNRIQEALYERAQDISDLRDVNASPLSSLERVLSHEDSPITMDQLLAFVSGHLDPKDDKPLALMIRQYERDKVKLGESIDS